MGKGIAKLTARDRGVHADQSLRPPQVALRRVPVFRPCAAETCRLARAAALDYAYARQLLAATVAKAWYLAAEARQQVALAEQAVTVYAELVALVTIRRDAGKYSNLDIASVSARQNAASAQVELAQQAYDESRRALAVPIGRNPGAEIEAIATFPALPPVAAAGLPASLLERRPDLAATEQWVLAALRRKEAARLSLLPNVGVSLVALREVETALANSADAVRIATIQYHAGRCDLLWVSDLQTSQLATEALVLRVRGLRIANRIQLFLGLGGSYDAGASAARSSGALPSR